MQWQVWEYQKYEDSVVNEKMICEKSFVQAKRVAKLRFRIEVSYKTFVGVSAAKVSYYSYVKKLFYEYENKRLQQNVSKKINIDLLTTELIG